jgi:hypothetical protein
MELQNDYTTKEQSYILLGLGIPKISANLYYDDEDEVQFVKDKEHELIGRGYFPCWSVGRLIEIYEIVGENAGQCVSTTKSTSHIENLVQLYEENAILLDFSKLEE